MGGERVTKKSSQTTDNVLIIRDGVGVVIIILIISSRFAYEMWSWTNCHYFLQDEQIGGVKEDAKSITRLTVWPPPGYSQHCLSVRLDWRWLSSLGWSRFWERERERKVCTNRTNWTGHRTHFKQPKRIKSRILRGSFHCWAFQQRWEIESPVRVVRVK